MGFGIHSVTDAFKKGADAAGKVCKAIYNNPGRAVGTGLGAYLFGFAGAKAGGDIGGAVDNTFKNSYGTKDLASVCEDNPDIKNNPELVKEALDVLGQLGTNYQALA